MRASTEQDELTYRSECPVARTLDLIGDRWSLLVLRDVLLREHYRFGELAASAEAIPTNVLTARLRSLVTAGLLERRLYQEHPPRYEYRPTARGEELRGILKSMARFGTDQLGGRSFLKAR